MFFDYLSYWKIFTHSTKVTYLCNLVSSFVLISIQIILIVCSLFLSEVHHLLYCSVDNIFIYILDMPYLVS
jgi:hypothetical protein